VPRRWALPSRRRWPRARAHQVAPLRGARVGMSLHPGRRNRRARIGRAGIQIARVAACRRARAHHSCG
jgi:hypothetical protein